MALEDHQAGCSIAASSAQASRPSRRAAEELRERRRRDQTPRADLDRVNPAGVDQVVHEYTADAECLTRLVHRVGEASPVAHDRSLPHGASARCFEVLQRVRPPKFGLGSTDLAQVIAPSASGQGWPCRRGPGQPRSVECRYSVSSDAASSGGSGTVLYSVGAQGRS